jgi:two-component system, chemotaxis family, CheB/CheR fusion protein
MGRVHDLLVGGASVSASLRSLVTAAVEPYVAAGRDSLTVTGSEIILPASTAATMGMILNELATNASKYGALSVADGKVDISWNTFADSEKPGERLRLNWIEHGGPRVSPDSTPGFGTNLIKRSVEYELGGTPVLELAPDGLHCTFEFPLRRQPTPVADKGNDYVQP